ncbi:MAG: UDP-glucose--hexose-1-phosphate uridylyltransferase [Oscillospiraceae bacterium]|nr:UDP-glucose--hexose-1-phosphate uridylyltransferase [Oscillospiraceae bacterium]
MICKAVQGLIDHSVSSGLITEEDYFVVRNMIMDMLKLSDWEDCGSMEGTPEEILNIITDYACENRIIENTAVQRDLFDTKIMGAVTPMPREVKEKFFSLYNSSPEKATDWYYQFCKDLNYVRADRIAKDLKWTYESEYGTLDITINRSKPEKDPRDIAAAKSQKKTLYPKCQLCAENMGFAGHMNHPARQNLRPVPLNIAGENWYLQYSPYGYYNEHCIVFNSEHTPMVIDASVFAKLFDFIEQFPHYFVGSNADLPIVGGSILTHEHFQGGRYCFAMENAPVEQKFFLKDFPEVYAGTVKWPMSVIRVSSADRRSLAGACDYILKKWRIHTDTEANIFSETEGIPHNTITPIARIRDGVFECDLVLRNNLTTEERPLGIYHPNPSLHHIKKENIGLIEVMGLAVLPSRLAEELEVLREKMLSGADLREDSRTSPHADWAEQILLSHPEFNEKNAEDILRFETGRVFEQVLCDAGVFKRTPEGQAAFKHFISVL